MLIRKFDPALLDSEPDRVLFRDLYPWDSIGETPFGASLAVIEGGGSTMLHSHHPAETFFIFAGQGTMTCNGESSVVARGDVVYLPPGSRHTLKNDSEQEQLMFLSVFWDAEAEETPTAVLRTPTARLILPSAPTPNGPLHLGHLSGPYLAGDVLRRFDRMKGLDSKVALLSDDHQSYAVLKSELEDRPVAEVAHCYAEQMVELMKAFDAAPDAWLFPSRDEEYRAAVKTAFDRLLAEGHLQQRPGEGLYCESCQQWLVDGRAVGDCPHCGATCRGFLCETCCLPNRTVDLNDPGCLDCDSDAVKKPLEQVFFALEPFRAELQQYLGGLRLSPRLLGLVLRMQSLPDLTFAVTQPGEWGIRHGDQVLSPWFEVALAAPYLRRKLGAEGAHVACFGADNAFLYLLHDPAVALALGAPECLPRMLVSNEHLLLEDKKMSTSAQHGLVAAQVLAQVNSDLVRLYLASVRPEQADVSCTLESMQAFLNGQVLNPWQDWLASLGRQVTTECGSKVPAPGVWSAEQYEYQDRLEVWLRQATRGYESGSLREVARVLVDLVERSREFDAAQLHLAGIPGLEPQRATAIALQLSAARLLAALSAPLMPKFAALLHKHLGLLKPETWPHEAHFLPPGQRVLAAAGLSARRYF